MYQHSETPETIKTKNAERFEQSKRTMSNALNHRNEFVHDRLVLPLSLYLQRY